MKTLHVALLFVCLGGALASCSLNAAWDLHESEKVRSRLSGQEPYDRVPSAAYMAGFDVPWRLDVGCRTSLGVRMDSPQYAAYRRRYAAYVDALASRMRNGDTGVDGEAQHPPTPWDGDALCPASDRDFVALAISGGGSRAAVFSAAVLFELQRYGLLQRVDVVSSISGGSLTAAYYALSCDAPYSERCPPAVEGASLFGKRRPRWEETETLEALQGDYLLKWAGGWVLPENVVRYWFTSYDRTDIMAEVLSDNLYDVSVAGGEPLRFQDLNPERPYLVINATDNTHLVSSAEYYDHPAAGADAGRHFCNSRRWHKPPLDSANDRGMANSAAPVRYDRHFAFTSDTFGCLHANLDQYEVGRAVMASAAFPMVFHYVTLKNYRPGRNEKGEFEYRYIHLMDGGTFDNLGLVGLQRVLDRLGERAQTDPLLQARRLLVLQVDAYSQGGQVHDRDADPRKVSDYLLDSNGLAATDVMMDQLRVDRIEAMRRRLGQTLSGACGEPLAANAGAAGLLLHFQFSDLAPLVKAETFRSQRAKFSSVMDCEGFRPDWLERVNAMPGLHFTTAQQDIPALKADGRLYDILYDIVSTVPTSFRIDGNDANCLRHAARIIAALKVAQLRATPGFEDLASPAPLATAPSLPACWIDPFPPQDISATNG